MKRSKMDVATATGSHCNLSVVRKCACIVRIDHAAGENIVVFPLSTQFYVVARQLLFLGPSQV